MQAEINRERAKPWRIESARPLQIDPAALRSAVRAALAEDLGAGDLTTDSIVPATTRARALMTAREPLRVAGLGFAKAAFEELSAESTITFFKRDGDSANPNEPLLEVTGPARALLSAERVALNFVQRLSGVATLTARFVAAIAGTKAVILDTRKTTPGWRLFEKYAVQCGGGRNHRLGLDDLILIKDNHLAALAHEPNPIDSAVRLARARAPGLLVEVETDTLDQVRRAAGAGADIILLDNMSLEELKQAAGLIQGRAAMEASGGIRLSNARAVAETGVDFISVGALTHSAPAVDIGLDFTTA